jgi:hypothetical protein
MHKNIEKAARESLLKMENIFTPGHLAERRDEMISMMKSGDAVYFEGAVRWNIFLTDDDKRLKGESESMKAALADMSGCLGFLANDHGDDAEVLCSIENSPQ